MKGNKADAIAVVVLEVSGIHRLRPMSLQTNVTGRQVTSACDAPQTILQEGLKTPLQGYPCRVCIMNMICFVACGVIRETQLQQMGRQHGVRSIATS